MRRLGTSRRERLTQGIGSSVLRFVAPLTYPSSETGLVIGVWYLIGLAVLVYLYVRRPARLPEMRRGYRKCGGATGNAAGVRRRRSRH